MDAIRSKGSGMKAVKGFSLVEILVVLVLISVLAGLGGLLLAPVINRYQVESEAVGQNQNLEAALARLIKEMNWANPSGISVESGGRTLRWTSAHPTPAESGEQVVAWNGTAGEPLQLNGQPLVSAVDNFAVGGGPVSGYLSLTLQLAGRSDLHQTRIYLRKVE